MKAREISPCAGCGHHPLTGEMNKALGGFNVVTVRFAKVDRQAAAGVIGMNTFFGGSALGLAEIMCPDPEVVKFDDSMTVEVSLCADCAMSRTLAEVVAKVRMSEEAQG